MKRLAINDLKIWLLQNKRKPLILRGARQVGKSTLVKLFAAENALDLVEINLEKIKISSFENSELDIHKIIQEIEYKSQKRITKKTLLFIDEIQESPRAIMALRYFYEERPDIAVIAAGSLLEFALNDQDISIPVGRVEYYHLGPMSFEEFLLALGQENLVMNLRKKPEATGQLVFDKLCRHLKEYYYIGGMPEAVATYVETKSFLAVASVHRSILETYKDDFPKYATKAESVNLGVLLSTISRHVGKKIKYSELLRDVKHSSIKKALWLLENARIVFRCTHSNASGIPLLGQIEESVFKIYFLDIGLLNSLLGIEAEETLKTDDHNLNNNIQGLLAEQFIAQQLKFLSQKSASETLFYWLRDLKKQGAEIDFMIQKSSEIIPIEVKSGKSGTLKSLIVFAFEKKIKSAIRFDLKKRSDDELTEKINTIIVDQEQKNKVVFKLLNYPIFLINFIFR
jgi:predicted AAA+ superfamily ATPase